MYDYHLGYNGQTQADGGMYEADQQRYRRSTQIFLTRNYQTSQNDQRRITG